MARGELIGNSRSHANTLDLLEVGLALHEAAGDRKITVEVRLLRWLVNRAMRKG